MTLARTYGAAVICLLIDEEGQARDVEWKLRVARRIHDLALERYGVDDAKLRRFRYGVQVNSLGLTERQPENNIARILLEMVGVTLSKDARARAVQLPAWNEALGLPRPWDQQWSLRLQQILAFESDILEYDDLFEGSRVVAESSRLFSMPSCGRRKEASSWISTPLRGLRPAVSIRIKSFPNILYRE